MKRSWLGWLAGAVVLLLGSSVRANPIVPANDGVGSVVNRIGNQFDITGGTRAGANLFHSLLKFGLSAEQIANFLSQPSIRNILTRVTGGETSVINGLIKVTGGNSNLYLMNPAGIVFGPNARLDIPGSFHATTANAIKVGDGWFGMNTPPSELMRLTGEPGGFAFSRMNQVLNGEIAGVIKNEGQLVVPGGQRVVLAGGVVVNTGVIETPHGQIIVTASPGGRYVEITPAGSVLSFSLPVAADQGMAVENLRPLRLEEVSRLAAGALAVGGRLATASSVVNRDSRIELVGEQVRLLPRVELDNRGTEGLIQIQVQPLVPVEGWVFLDRVRNYEAIANSLEAGNRLVLLNRSDSGVEKVNQALAGQTDVKALHLVGDGNAGQIWLGRDFITLETLGGYAASIQQWGQYLHREGGIYLYACNLAQTAAGQTLVNQIGELTGAQVGASVDITGHGKYGGNWVLEYGRNPQLPLTLAQVEQADVKLMTFTVTKNTDTALSGVAGELRSELDNANTTVGADIVRFSLGAAPSTITLSLGELVVNDTKGGSTTFDNVGGTVTIDAQFTSRVFNIKSSNTVIFDGTGGGIVIRNGDVVGDGGGIFIDTGSTVTIQGNVQIKNNIADNGGGIFVSSGSTLTMTGGVISENEAAGGSRIGAGIDNKGTLTLTQVTVAKNGLVFGVNDGGGLANELGAVATIIDSTFSGNFANNGGGIDNQGTLIITNSTIGNNEAFLDGGGIRNLGGTATLKNVTIVGNQVSKSGQPGGGGIRNTGTVNIGNSIVAGNTDANGVATDQVSDVGTFTITDPNLVGQNGNLGGFPANASNIVVPGAVLGVQVAPLANNGGPTETFALLPGSLAINASGAGATAVDQRGVPAVGIRDLGAFESPFVPGAPPPVGVLPPEERLVLTVELGRFLTQEREQLLFQPYLCSGDVLVEGAPPPLLPACVQGVNVRQGELFFDFLRN